MKVKCPVCGIEGFVERRGSSVRILHYKGFMKGRRMYEKHSIAFSDSQLIPNTMGINNPETCPELNSKWTGGDLHPYTSGDITRNSPLFLVPSAIGKEQERALNAHS